MRLVDTSVWIDFLRGSDDRLADWLKRGKVATHPFIVGELACGNIQSRSTVLGLLKELHHVPVASHVETMHFIDRHRLHGRGLGYVDIHLLAAAKLSGYTRIVTRDSSLQSDAERLGLLP